MASLISLFTGMLSREQQDRESLGEFQRMDKNQPLAAESYWCDDRRTEETMMHRATISVETIVSRST